MAGAPEAIDLSLYMGLKKPILLGFYRAKFALAPLSTMVVSPGGP